MENHVSHLNIAFVLPVSADVWNLGGDKSVKLAVVHSDQCHFKKQSRSDYITHCPAHDHTMSQKLTSTVSEGHGLVSWWLHVHIFLSTWSLVHVQYVTQLSGYRAGFSKDTCSKTGRYTKCVSGKPGMKYEGTETGKRPVKTANGYIKIIPMITCVWFHDFSSDYIILVPCIILYPWENLSETVDSFSRCRHTD